MSIVAVARTDCVCSAQQLASVLVPPQNHPHSKLLGFRHKAWSGRAPISKKMRCYRKPGTSQIYFGNHNRCDTLELKLFKHFGNNHVKFEIGFALWVRTTAERRSTLELKLHEIFVTAKNVPEQLIP